MTGRKKTPTSREVGEYEDGGVMIIRHVPRDVKAAFKKLCVDEPPIGDPPKQVSMNAKVIELITAWVRAKQRRK